MSTNTKVEYALGFESQLSEASSEPIDVCGSLPQWLRGTLLRNGPSQYEIDGQEYRHWFDGLAKLHKFEFADGKICFASKFLKSKAYTQGQNQQRIVLPEFATNPNRSLLEKIGNIFHQELTDNANVNIVQWGGQCLAMTETPVPIEFDCSTLDTSVGFRFDDNLSGHVTTAHPQFDFRSKTLYNISIKFGPTSTYSIYRLEHGSLRRKVICSWTTKQPSYFHSFAMSKRYIVLAETPFVADPIKLIFGSTYIGSYQWLPNRGTYLHLINKDTGEKLTVETEPCFYFHQVNAFESNGEIFVDLMGYDNADIVGQLYLQNLQDPDGILALPRFKRYRISLMNKSVKTEEADFQVELPRIAYEQLNGQSYRYFYGNGRTKLRLKDGYGFLDQLSKIDIDAGSCLSWQEGGCYPGEPVFVARTNSSAEDDGVILSVVLDAINKGSFLLVLDAKTMLEIARAPLNTVIPFGFHGQFIKKE